MAPTPKKSQLSKKQRASLKSNEATNEPSRPVTPPNTNQIDTINILVFAEVDSELSTSNVRSILRREVNFVLWSPVGFGNRAGKDKLSSFKETEESRNHLADEMKSLRKEMNETKSEMKELRETLTTQTQHTSRITVSSSNFLDIRRRNIDKFIYQNPGDLIPASSDAITLGNIRAHDGDCFNDARVFIEDGRPDVQVFISLYGVEPAYVLDIYGQERTKEVIDILDAWGTQAYRKRTPPVQVQQAFDHLLEEVTRSGATDLEDHSTPRGQACASFWSHFCPWQRRRR